MNDLINKLLDKILGPEAIMAEPGFDPTTEPLKAKTQRKNWLVVGLLIGGPLVLVAVVFGVSRVMAIPSPTPTPCKEPALCPDFFTATVTLPNPQMQVITDTPDPFATPSPLPNLLTEMALLPTSSPTRTEIKVDGILTSIVTTPCNAENFLTQQVCDNIDMSATFASVGIGTPINVSGVGGNVTMVYVYPSASWTPWVITTTPTYTPVVVTVEVSRVVTATPGPALPTQTPWFYITQPPVVTVVWTQLVTVVVTATPTETPIPSETPTLTATPTLTPTPTETPTP